MLKLTHDEYVRYMTLTGANPNAVEPITTNCLKQEATETDENEA